MAIGTELFNLATSFDPYGAYRKGQMAPQAYDVEQQKLGLEQQKMGLQKLQLAEQQKELTAEQDKTPELATMAQNVLGPQYKLTDDTGLPTAAGQMNTLLLQGKQEASQGQKLLRDAQFESDPKNRASLISEGRRLLNNAVKYQGDAKKLAQTEQNNALYGLGTAANKEEWDNVIKGWENNGLPIPKGFPTEFSPENIKKVASLAPLDVQQKISSELKKRTDEELKITKQKLEIQQLQAKQRNGWKPLKGAGVGEEVAVSTEKAPTTEKTFENKLEDPNYGVAKGKVPSREITVARRISTDAREVTQGIDQVMALTEGGMKNITGSTLSNVKDSGLLTAPVKAFTNIITPQDSQMYDAMMYPLVKGIALYSNPDYRPTDNDVKIAMQSYKALANQPHAVQLEKLAELKKNFNAASESFLDSKILNAEQAASLKKQIKEVNRAIPWNVNDVVGFTRQKEYKSFQDYLRKKPSEPTKETKTTEEKPSETKRAYIGSEPIIVKDGKWVYEKTGKAVQ